MKTFEEDMLNDVWEKDLEKKIVEDQKISNVELIDISQLISDAKTMRNILHLRDQNKKQIIYEFEKNIIVDIPIGTENTLASDLKQFNNELYGDNDSIVFDFVPTDKKIYNDNKKVHRNPRPRKFIKNDDSIDNNTSLLSDDEKKSYFEMLNNRQIKVVENLELTEEEIDNKVLNSNVDNDFNENKNYSDHDYLDKFIKSDENNFNSKIIVNDENNFQNELTIEEFLDNSNSTIVVSNEDDKNKIIQYVEKQIDDGDFKLMKINRPLAISGKKINKKIKSIRQKFIDTYGSEIFSKVSKWIVEEQNIYNNLDRIDRINRYKENKIKLAKKMQTKDRLRRFFK